MFVASAFALGGTLGVLITAGVPASLFVAVVFVAGLGLGISLAS